MASGLLGMILTGLVTLDHFFTSIKKHPLDDYNDQEGSRDVIEAKVRQYRPRMS